jgi:hypothetical protein
MKNLKVHLLLILVIGLAFPACSQRASHPSKKKLILRDEGLSQLSFEDMEKPEANWYTKVPPGRDLQLIGNGLVLIGTGTGYEEREVASGKKVKELTSYAGTMSARRLRNGNTLLAGLNWQGKQGVSLIEVDDDGNIKRTIDYPELTSVRLVRETPGGTFLITSNVTVYEGNADGEIIKVFNITGPKTTNVWQAMRTEKGKTVICGGYSGNIQIFDTDAQLIKTITGPEEVHPKFYAGCQILPSGNIIVTNWQGHGPEFGESGTQLLEYTQNGDLVWSWKQDASKYSSLQGVIVLDGLDVKKLHVENEKGVLTPVK